MAIFFFLTTNHRRKKNQIISILINGLCYVLSIYIDILFKYFCTKKYRDFIRNIVLPFRYFYKMGNVECGILCPELRNTQPTLTTMRTWCHKLNKGSSEWAWWSSTPGGNGWGPSTRNYWTMDPSDDHLKWSLCQTIGK